MKQCRRATSLVEVLVVLVILLIGVFSVIRVFPLGFTFLRNSESRMRGTRVGHGLLEKAQNEAANLPDAIAYSYFSGNSGSMVRSFVVDEDPDDLTGDPASPYYSDVNKFRFIVGEPVKIGLPTPTATTSGSIYMAKLGPIYMDALVGNPANAPATAADSLYYNLFLSIRSAPLNVAPAFIARDPYYQASSGQPFFFSDYYRARLTGPTSCLVDENEDANGGAWMLFYPSSRDRVFTVRFIKLVNDHDDDPYDNAVAVTDRFVVPASTQAVWIRLCDPSHLSYNTLDPATTFAADDAIQSGSEVVTREFTRLAAGAAWDPEDPYQYQLVSNNLDAASGKSSVANPGIVAFNPVGARFANNGQDPFKAYMDYAVLDWHIIHDDRDVPAVAIGAYGEVPLRTTLTRIKSLDYINPDNTFYEGIFPAGDTDASKNTDIMIVRLDTGAILNPGASGRPGDYGLLQAGDPAQVNQDYWVNTDPKTGSYATGTLYINTNRVALGTPIRILYKAEGEWGAALSKAMATYREVTAMPSNWTLDALTGLTTSPDRPDLFWRTTAGSGAAAVGALNFAGTELNKGVTVVFQVLTNGSWRRSAAVQLAIDTPNVQLNAANERRVISASVDVTKFLKPLGWDGTHANWRVATDIKGATAKSRVIWKDGLERNAPWRIQDLDTYLTQGVLQ
ncbi:hypothetical protein [Armatimonas rosea]|uniref:Uncharacterized protein n=1 Tax=Armatimonas rosea TaxID=685828 RepID=A0A7W9SKJ9_ARMRO|nr:hypothetical protein [Armatimonas rosea]MBB6048305.1 hypothetical protein [Armatimonas rosea]